MEHPFKIRPAMVFRAVTLLMYSVFFLYLAVGGSIVKYVHPRYNAFLVVSCAVSAFVIIAMLIPEKSASQAKISPWHAAVFILPLLFAFAGRNMDVNYSDSFSSGDGDYQNEDDVSGNLPAFVLKARDSDTINLVDAHFVQVMDDMYNNPGLYMGKRISLTGIALKRKYAGAADEFAIVRMMMVCCAADLQPVGIICRYNDAQSIKAQGWYRVSGKINLLTSDGADIPVIMIEEAEGTEKPANEYVYPY